MTQESLADVAGLSVRAIRDIERGTTERPYRHSLESIAAAMGLSETDANDLIGSVYVRSDARRRRSAGRSRNHRTERGAVQQEMTYIPPPLRSFVGRADIMGSLDKLLAGRIPGDFAAALLAGAPGVGKTALALTWAHRSADRFPHGVVYEDLRGHGPHRPFAHELVLRRLLRSLGVPDHKLPLNYEDCSALYQTTLAKRRLLIILDNAATPEQVRPLLTGAPECLVLATSRNAMTGLVVRDGVRRFHMSSLTEAESYELFASVVGKEKTQQEPDVTAALLDMCDHLPLAVRVLAERVRNQPSSSIAEVAARLVGTRSLLSIFEMPGDPQSSMRGILSWSYDALPVSAVRVFTALGAVSRMDFTFAEAAKVVEFGARAEIDDETLAEALDWLVEASLLKAKGPGRYEFNRLIWNFAQEKFEESERRIVH